MIPLWLRYFAEYLLMLPSMMFCILPLRKRFRYPLKKVYAVAFGTVACMCLAATLAGLWGWGWLNPNALALTAVVACPICLKITDTDFFKLLNIFVNAVAFLSFTGYASYLVECRMNPEGGYRDVASYGLLVQWALMLLMLTFMWPLLKKQYAWLISDYDEEYVWRVSWIVPALIAACVISMVPIRYSTMQIGRVFSVTLIMIGVLFCLLILFNIIFYRMAKRSVERIRLEQRASILELQVDQYAQLRAYMEQTAQQRHDFRHSIRVLDELARKGELEELRRYAREYGAKLEAHAPKTYCANPAANALLGYYAQIAQENGIDVEFQIDMPERPPIAEVDLCNLLGNLLENAIDACRLLPREQRRLAISAEMCAGQRIYIVSTNSFDGNLLLLNGSPTSTKHSGEGMGLKSIRAIAERYRGSMGVHTEGKRFCVDVYLKGENAPAG